MLAGEVLILTGPPGAGKTSVARAIARSWPRPAVHLTTDDFWHAIASGLIPPYEPAAQRQNEVVMAVIAGAAAGYARGGYFVIVDGIVGPWFLPAFGQLDVPLHYIVLRPPLAVAMTRAQLRSGAQALTASAPIRTLHAQFADLGAFEHHAVDSAPEPLATTVGRVRAALDGRFRLAL